MVKYILEEETIEKIDGENNKVYTKVSELGDKSEAEKVEGKTRFVHICRHDEGASCRREAV